MFEGSDDGTDLRAQLEIAVRENKRLREERSDLGSRLEIATDALEHVEGTAFEDEDHVVGLALTTLRAQSPAEPTHAVMVLRALLVAQQALESAEVHGRRLDCLRDAVRALSGALSCVFFEDLEARRGK